MLKKVLLTLVALFVILIVAAVSIPMLFKEEILTKVKSTINDEVNAKVDFSGFDISLINSFPNLGLQLNDLRVIGVDSFATDTLADIKQLQINVNLMSVINGGTYEIRSVELNEPKIYAKVLKSGKANWDIAKADTIASSSSDAESTPFKAALKKYSIEDGSVIYDDASLGVYTQISNLNHSGKGDFTQDLFTLKTQTDIEQLTVKYGGVPYLNKVKLSAELPIDIDMAQMKFTLGDNKIKLNELLLTFIGNLMMPSNDDMVLDFKFSAEKSDLKNFLSLIPAIYASNFKDLQASGNFGMSGSTKGIYNEKSLPAFNVDLAIENGKIQYTSLPSAINNIQVKANVNNPDGVIDHTVVNVPAFHLEFGNAPIDGRLLVKNPMSDPFVDMAVKGKIDLKEMTAIFPMEGMTLSGLLDADLKAAGKKSSIDKGQYEAFNASGSMQATNFNYAGEAVPMPVSIPNASMSFSPKNITLSSLSAKVGKSDFQANGTVNNYLAYVFQKEQPLQGTFNVNSSLVDVNELMGPPIAAATSSAADTAKLSVFEVPGNIDFVLAANAGKVIYDNYDITNAKGQLTIKDKTIRFKDMGMNMLDGALTMNGSYSTAVNPKQPKVDMDFAIEKMSIQKAFTAFNTVKLLAPIAKYTTGEFSTNLKFNSDLDEQMMPIYSSINAEGLANIVQAVVKGFEPVQQLASVLKIDQLKNLEVNNLIAKLKVENGRLIVSPFNIKPAGIAMNVQGTNGIDQTMDYKLVMDVPRSILGTQANEAMNSLVSAFNSKAGTNVAMGETVKVNVAVGGTMLKPTIKPVFGGGDAKSSAKEMLASVVDEKKAELTAKATEEVAKLKEKATEEVKKQTDTLKKQATEKAKEKVGSALKGLFNK